MWTNPHGIRLFSWHSVMVVLVAAACVLGLVFGLAFVFKLADNTDARLNRAQVLCPDKVAKMKLTPSEARIAYDLCKETEGKLP